MTTTVALVRSLGLLAVLLCPGCSRSGPEPKVPRVIPLARAPAPAGWKLVDRQLSAERCWWKFTGRAGETMKIDAWQRGDGEASSIADMYEVTKEKAPHLTREWSKEDATFRRYGLARQGETLDAIVTIVDHPRATLSVEFRKPGMGRAGEGDVVVEKLIQTLQAP